MGFWNWIQQSTNANIVLVGVTTVYVFLTWRIVRATARQAAAMLQPVLSVSRFSQMREGRNDNNNVLVKNLGNQPVVFLHVVLTCHIFGHETIIRHEAGYRDHVLATQSHIIIPFDFSTELALDNIQPDFCGFGIFIVVSDLSRQVVAQYVYAPVVGHLSCTLGYPIGLRWRNFNRIWIWRYSQLKPWFKKLKSLGEWENSEASRSQDRE
jgi:hypothetical protein